MIRRVIVMKKMNHSGNILFCLCTALLLAADMGRAETVFWSDDFDDSGASSRWKASTPGVWHIGSPTAGPAKNSEGYRTHSGANCASTQLYAYNDSRLVCNNYDGDSSLVVPSADQFPRLRFWHWFNFGNAIGFVEISTDAGSTWQQISPSYTYDDTDTATSGGVWSRPSIDLSAYAGQSVQIAFHFAGLCCGNGLGWYVDDVAVVTDEPVFNNPEGFESGEGDWAVDSGTWEIGQPTSGPKAAHTGDNCAATILAGNYTTNVDSRLISPPFLVPSNSPALRFYHWYNFNNALGFVEISTDAGSTWNQLSQTYQDGSTGNQWINVSLDLSAYAGQTVQAAFHFTSGGIGTAAGWYVDDLSLVAPPTLTVPPTQTIYVGQTLTVTNYATNSFFPADALTFALVSPPKTFTNLNLDPTSGVLTWTPAPTQTPSTNTITVKVTDNVLPFLSATNSFIVQVLKPYPVLTVPPTQTIYAGQTLVVTNYATNSVYPDATFTFALLSGPTNMDVSDLPADGVLQWVTTTTQRAGTYTNIVMVSDDESLLSATNRFLIVVSNPPPPTLIVPPKQTIYAGQTLTVTNSATSVYPNSTFTFALLSGPTNMDVSDLPADGVLQWVTATNQRAGNYTNVVTVQDSISLLSATNRFVIVVSNPPPPTLTVPPKQTIFAGQTLIVTNSATSVYPNSTFTFALLSGLTNVAANLDVSDLTNNGVLRWATATKLPAGNYTNVVTVQDSVSLLNATNRFVIVVSNPPPPTLTVPPKQTIYAGQTLTVTNSATSVYPNSTFTFALLSGPAGVNLDPNTGILTWATATKQLGGNYTNTVTVQDSVSLLSATNRFVIVVSNPPPPTLTVPPKQTIFAGQTLIVTNSATSVYPNSTFTFALLSGLTNVAANLDVSDLTNNGVLRWATATKLPAGNYTNVVTVQDSVSLLSATNRFVVVVSNPPPPTLTVPPKQTIYAGQTLIVTNYATSVYTNSAFTFALLSGPAGANLDPNTGILTWVTTTKQPAGNYTNVVSVQDSVSLLSTNKSFVVVVSTNPPPPTLIVPPAQTIYAGQTLIVTNYAYYTNSVFPSSAFTFATNPPTPTGVNLDPNTGVLTWATTIAQLVGTYTNVITVMDSLSHLSATSNFLVQVLPPQPPTLMVPPTQMIYAGQLLVVTNYATNAYPGDTFTFAAFGPPNMDVSNLPKNGVLKWTPTTAQAPSANTIYVKVTDNNSLSAISNFLVLVLTTPPPGFTVPPTQTLPSNGFQFKLNTMPDTIWRIDASTNLSSWKPVSTNTADSSGTLQFTDSPASYPRRFYRAVLP